MELPVDSNHRYRQWFSDDMTEHSDISVDLPDKEYPIGRVRFCLEKNVSYKSTYDTDDLETTLIWYNEIDFELFKNDVREYAYSLHSLMTRNAANEGHNWLRMLSLTHQKCSSSEKIEDVNKLLALKARPFSTSCLGIERWAIPSVRKARSQQLRRQYHAVNLAQKTSSKSKDEEIRRKYIQTSQAGRVFAMCIGHVLQEEVQRNH